MSERRPGEWPGERVELPEPEPGSSNTTRARFAVTLGSVRADLEEQPNERTMRAAARMWTNAITQLADEIAKHRRRHSG